MSTSLIKTFPRLWSLQYGMAMVVTDLHGDWDVYQRYRDRFVDLQAKGQANWFIFTGDLIHSYDLEKPDRSLDIVLDVMDLQASYGQNIIYIIGNHEITHIYSTILARGDHLYTPGFEAELSSSNHRDKVIAMFDKLPFFVRTRSGVTLTHAGASISFANPENAEKIFNWDHKSLLDSANKIIEQSDLENLQHSFSVPYHDNYSNLTRDFLSVSGPDDPRYNDLLRGFIVGKLPEFEQILWPLLFDRCEQQYGHNYPLFLDKMLKELSVDFFTQQLLVSGHIATKKGHQIVTNQHLRLSSGYHASRRNSGQYLLFDVAMPVMEAKNLLPNLGTIYDKKISISIFGKRIF